MGAIVGIYSSGGNSWNIFKWGRAIVSSLWAHSASLPGFLLRQVGEKASKKEWDVWRKKGGKRVKHGGEKVKELTTASHALECLPPTLVWRIWQLVGNKESKVDKDAHSQCWERGKGEKEWEKYAKAIRGEQRPQLKPNELLRQRGQRERERKRWERDKSRAEWEFKCHRV